MTRYHLTYVNELGGREDWAADSITLDGPAVVLANSEFLAGRWRNGLPYTVDPLPKGEGERIDVILFPAAGSAIHIRPPAGVTPNYWHVP